MISQSKMIETDRQVTSRSHFLAMHVASPKQQNIAILLMQEARSVLCPTHRLHPISTFPLITRPQLFDIVQGQCS